MIQGWFDNQYLIIFEGPDESKRMSDRYGIGSYLPGYDLVAIYNWDDFIVCDQGNQMFKIPTIPLDRKYLQPFEHLEKDASQIQFDQRFADKIKWYIKPLIFGGDAENKSNIAWVSLDQHTRVVKWWNQVYIDAKRGT